MPVLEYYGDLWGFGVEGKIFCNSCYRQRSEKITKGIFALGTEDRDEVESGEEKKFVYICDECGRSNI
jgi:hypothetical protein